MPHALQGVNIPITAWEQGLVITLFVVLLMSIFGGVAALLNNQRKAQLASQKELLQQQQEFIEEQNIQWQSFLREQRAADAEMRNQDRSRIEELAQLFKLLTSEVKALVSDFSQHDEMERAKLDEMSKTIHERNKPRGKVQ
jgi:hypothetical protein